MVIERGIRFGNIHSFYDLDLILSGVEIPPAKPKENYIDIPGGEGSIDLSAVHGEVRYSDRDGCKFTFTMNPAGELTDEAFEAKKSEVSNALNGRAFEKITLDKDDEWYYTGRCKVNEYLSNKRIRQIVVTARLKPYKYKQRETVKTYELTRTARVVHINNSRKSVCPIIECTSDDCNIVVPDKTVIALSAGTHKNLDIRFVEGQNVLALYGTGQVTFRFQEASL